MEIIFLFFYRVRTFVRGETISRGSSSGKDKHQESGRRNRCDYGREVRMTKTGKSRVPAANLTSGMSSCICACRRKKQTNTDCEGQEEGNKHQETCKNNPDWSHASFPGCFKRKKRVKKPFLVQEACTFTRLIWIMRRIHRLKLKFTVINVIT